MRRVLIVSPHFPPANGADVHRVRAVVPFLRQFGWEPHVLAVDPRMLAVPQDSWLADGVPADLPVQRVRALGLGWAAIPGLGSLDFRALRAMRLAGLKLLRSQKFDLVYFSTTVFSLHVLGPHWRRRTGVPFLIDYQDPWVSDYYRENPGVTPPGGRFKNAIMNRIHSHNESRVISRCSGITSVSSAYPQQLKRRYPHLGDLPSRVLQFPVALRDLERIRESSISQSVFPVNDGLRHWVYVGRGGSDMAKSLQAIFISLRRWKNDRPEDYRSTRVHFIGTSYAPVGKGEPTVLPLAAECGVADIVTESTDRIAFSSMLKCLLDADALIVPGSDDAGYTASKLLPYLVAGKPVLTVFHERSPTCQLLRELGGAVSVTFRSDDPVEGIADRVTEQWFVEDRFEKSLAVDHEKIRPYTDQGQAEILGDFFSAVVNGAA
jgi:glycosyltransferase involved in cell wall biosynthesis